MDLTSLMKSEFRLAQLSGERSEDQAQLLEHFRSVLLEQEHSYPEIRRWLRRRVVPQLDRADRSAYVAYSDGHPIGAAVFKLSHRPKLCHLSIAGHARRQRLGDAFLGLLALQVGRTARNIHFTIPESVWEEQKSFFSRFGFSNHGEASRQYRLFDRELFCSASVDDCSRVALARLGELAEELQFGPVRQHPSLLLSIRPEPARRILQGRKRVEIRRKFSERWVGHRIALYASHPVQAVVGEATIEMVEKGTPREIWRRYEPDIGCTLGQFRAYCGGSGTLSAVGLREVSRFETTLKRSSLVSMFGRPMRPPQSYFLLRDRTPWSNAVSLASSLDSGAVAKGCRQRPG